MGGEMKSATELLGEMLRIYDDPDKSTAQLYLWVHQQQDEIREVVEGGEEIEPEPCACVDPDCPLFHRNSYTNPSQEQLKGWMEDSERLDWLEGQPRGSDNESIRAGIDRARGEGE